MGKLFPLNETCNIVCLGSIYEVISLLPEYGLTFDHF